MISSLRGTIIEKSTTGAVIECAGVGYGVSMSLTSLQKLGAVGTDVHILVHTFLSQDALRLYGFVEHAERDTFEVLIGTSGVGPKLALAILSTLHSDELADAVERRDKSALTRIPGVGAKKAERLFVELKDRIKPSPLHPGYPHAPPNTQDDFVSALINLGFKPADAEKVARQTMEQNASVTDLAELVRAAIKPKR